MALVPSTSTPAAAVDSVFARTGAVVAVSGDYTAAQVGATGNDGWASSADTWVYASASTFTIAAADRTAVYTPGTRIRCVNVTTKYFVVVASAFSTNTTVTVTGGTDYALANAAITAPSYSYASSPPGYPGWFNYTATLTGMASTTSAVCYFAVDGRLCRFNFNVSGTSNTSTATWTLTIPVPVSSSAPTSFALSRVGDNSLALTAPGAVGVVASATVATVYRDLFLSGAGATNWTPSGNKAALGQLIYPI